MAMREPVRLVGFDPTPREIAHEVSPRTVAWVDQMWGQSRPEPADGDWANAQYRAFENDDRAPVDAILQGTGVETMFSPI
jgi:hypothetical protein